MFCPRCLSPLNKGKDLRIYETLVEHVIDPNGIPTHKEYYYCSNDLCPTRKYDIFWDFYGSDYRTMASMKESLFILDCANAINSNSRKHTLEIRKKIITLFKFYRIRIDLDKYPIVDKIGIKIKGYRYKIALLIKNGLVYSYYNPGIKMFFYCIKDFNQKYKLLLEKQGQETIKDVIHCLEYRDWDKRWWKVLSIWVLNKLYPGLKDLLKKSLV